MRKAYITNMKIHMAGGDVKLISQHSSENVINQNYIDQEVLAIAKSTMGFSVFPKETSREKELKEIREDSINTNEKNKEVKR